MNVDEARVPNVDPDWAIEIFLFSNGQQFSPPRKYYLRADELNSWQATLNYLATSHYGLQCPQIRLFTTDGQLVDGPLGLNGGQAYVAVVEPDRFVDTGYQKYLIKASRSWEKRKARKKDTECAPDKPCCLCPEKEWCCDPQTSCICLEKEDSHPQSPLLHVSEHVELRPADGQYVSSTPTKPKRDYGPRSGEIEPITGEHEVRSGEFETSPAKYEYSPLPAPAKPDQNEAGISVNGANPAEQAPKLSNEPRPGEYRTRSDESGTKRHENTGRAGEYEINRSNHAAKFIETEAKPGEYGANWNEYGSRLSQNGERPVEYLPTLSENEPRLSKNVVKPEADGAKPGENMPRLADYQTRSSRNGVRPKEYGARPGAYKPKPIGKEVTPDKYGAKQGEFETRPNRNEARPGEYGARPGEYIGRPSVNRAKPREYVPKVSEYKPRSNENGDKLSEHGVVPREHETRPSVHRDRPGKYGTKPGEYAARPSECETRPSVNGVRPGEHVARLGEYETRPSINSAKPGDTEARPGKTEIWSGEDVDRPPVYGLRAENEHTRRISEQGGADIQQGGRTGVPTREFDHGGKVSEQKGKETNLAGRAGGQRARENGARLSEQRNKLIDFLPRSGGRDNDPEGRPGCRVNRPMSRIAAPVSRPSTRDKINSRARTSDLGQPKSRTPTRVDETAARLDDSEIKNTMHHPGARPGSAGGTAIAGTLHVSEAQQHARKSSLFAGRPSTEKKHSVSISQNSTLLKKPTLISSALRKLRDKQPMKAKQEIPTNKTNENISVVPVSADILTSKTLPECTPEERSHHAPPLPTISVTNECSPTTNKAPLENTIGDTDKLESEMTTAMRFDSVKHFVDAINNSPRGTQTEIIYIGKSTASYSINEEVKTSTEAVDTKLQAQEETSSNKVIVLETSQTSTEAVATKQHAQEESTSNKAKVDLGTFQYRTEAVDTKQKAQEKSGSNKVKVDSDTFQTSAEAVDTKQYPQEEPASNKEKVDSGTFQYSTEAVDKKQQAQEKSVSNKAKVDSDTFQTSAEAVDTKQYAQEESASNTVKIDSDACCLCSQRDHKPATGDPDANTIPIVYQGDGGTINLKLDIKIRNIVKSVYSCQKNCEGVRSVTNIMTSEKESQISIEDNFLLLRDSFNSIFHKNYSRSYGFDFSPNVMVVQCAGCGKLKNPPGCDPTQCCDNNKKYFVMLTNSVNEGMDDSCNQPCRPSDIRQTQLKKQNSIIPVKKSYSEMNNSQNLETITTVTVSGVPLQNREMKKCNLKNSLCQTEETHDCMISKHKVSITEESITTATSEIQKKSSSSSNSLTAKRSRLKIIQEICPEIKEHESSLYSQTDPVSCQKIPSACTNVSAHTCPRTQSMGCEQTCPPVQTQGCLPVSCTCPSCCPMPLACIQIQTHVSPHGPQVSNMETQTQWKSLILQARLHCDGRYSFHLPSLNVLNSLPF